MAPKYFHPEMPKLGTFIRLHFPDLSLAERSILSTLIGIGDGCREIYPSRAMIAKRSCVSESTVERVLKSLRKRGIIRIYARFAKDGGRLTSRYEINFRLLDAMAETDTLQADQQRDTRGEIPVDEADQPVEDPEEEAAPAATDALIPAPKSRVYATALPEDWRPSDELLEWARSEFPGLNVQLQTDMFCDYWHSIGGSRARKTRWDLAWRNWVRKAASDMPGGQRGSQQRGGQQQKRTLQDKVSDHVFLMRATEAAYARGFDESHPLFFAICNQELPPHLRRDPAMHPLVALPGDPNYVGEDYPPETWMKPEDLKAVPSGTNQPELDL